jgi:hypothetical protein
MAEIPFKDLPLCTPDYEADYPAVAQALKNAAKAFMPQLWIVRSPR